MKILRVEHIGIAVRDIEMTKKIFEDAFGLSLTYEETFEVHSLKMAMYPVGETQLEFLQGMAGTDPTSEWVEEHGEGLWHVCFEVEDIRAALAELRGKGIDLVHEEPVEGHEGNLVAFISPSSTSNIVVELVEKIGR